RWSMAESGGRQRGDSECPPFSILRRALRVCSGTTAPRDHSLGRRDGRTAAPCGSVSARVRKLGFAKWRKSLEMSLESVRIEFDRRTESPSSLPAQASRRYFAVLAATQVRPNESPISSFNRRTGES